MLKFRNIAIHVCKNVGRIDKRLFTATILGIETSCDDCGAAVVTSQKKLLGEALSSQTSTTVKLGGVLPPIAAQLHAEHIDYVVSQAMNMAGLSFKVARRLRLFWLNDGQYRDCSGGMAVEMLAQLYDCENVVFDLPIPRSNSHDCDFSFSGIHVATERLIDKLENLKSAVTSSCEFPTTLPLSEISRLCFSVQQSVSKLICRRVQRAIEFCSREKMLSFGSNTQSDPENDRPALVVSGGVASNSYIKSELSSVAQHYGMRVVAPPPSLCTDNGVMIAWNGALLFNSGLRKFNNPDLVDFTPQAPLGVDIRALVRDANIKIKPLNIYPARKLAK